jgi:predicted CoA-binding protein
MADLEAILRATRTIAVLGAHDDPARPAHYVPAYMAQQGYRVFGVNPQLAGRDFLGQPIVARLEHLPGPVDMIDVFRRSEHLAAHLDEIVALDPPPACVWLQLGIRDDAFARALEERGIAVVQDRCLMVDHRRLVR